MKQKGQLLLAVKVLIIIFAIFIAQVNLGYALSKPIKIGVILPLTGELGNFGKTVLNGVQLALDDFKRTNPKIKIDLYTEDSQAKPAVAVSALQKLRDVDKVNIVIGDLTSSATLAMAPVADKSHMLLMSPTASNPALSKAGPYFFRVWTSDSFDGKVAADYIRREMKVSKVGVLYINNDYGVGLKDVFSKTFSSLGGQVLFNEGYAEQQTDFRSVLIKMKELNLDGLYIPGHPQGIGRILKQSKELGIEVPIFSCVAAEDHEFLKIAGNAAANLLFTAPAFDIASDRKNIKSFVETYRKRFSEMPDTHAVHGYDSMATILSGIAKGNITPDTIGSYLHRLKNYSGLSGNFHFDANGDVVTAVAVKRYDNNGNISVVKIVSPK